MTGDVELDCSGLTFLDASGLRVILAAHRACQARDAMLTIVDPSRCVVRLLALTGLDAVLGSQAESSAP
jgi:anti-sigma B factor antagonist